MEEGETERSSKEKEKDDVRDRMREVKLQSGKEERKRLGVDMREIKMQRRGRKITSTSVHIWIEAG